MSLHSLQNPQRQQLAGEVDVLLLKPEVSGGVSEEGSGVGRALHTNQILGLQRALADNNPGQSGNICTGSCEEEKMTHLSVNIPSTVRESCNVSTLWILTETIWKPLLT